jgi:hypothetical protein
MQYNILLRKKNELENSSMRKITIHQGSNIIEVLDDDDSKIGSYCKDLSKLFDMGNISLLETSHATVILRPSKINSIIVENVQDDKEEVSEEVQKEKTEDIIMDLD